ncbi:MULTISPECIES: hypothetical protein [unclassified Lysinibacillus]|nr:MULTISPECIES: hypothetical protein [unclassified Lysinibacillus]MDM5248186.1 hypothetical protein [Lysinibacillus sp. G4S2]
MNQELYDRPTDYYDNQLFTIDERYIEVDNIMITFKERGIVF